MAQQPNRGPANARGAPVQAPWMNFFRATETDNTAALGQEIMKGIPINLQEPRNGWSATHVAVMSQSLTTLEFLVAADTFLLDQNDGFIDEEDRLPKEKADPNLIDKNGLTPLDYVHDIQSQMGPLDGEGDIGSKLAVNMMETILEENGAVRAVDILRVHVENGEFDKAAELLERNVSPLHKYEDGKSLIDIATEKGATEFAEMVEAKAKSYPQRQAPFLVRKGDLNGLKVLQEDYGLDLNHVYEENGWNLAHYAVDSLQPAMLNYLFEQNVRLNKVTNGGQTIVDFMNNARGRYDGFHPAQKQRFDAIQNFFDTEVEVLAAVGLLREKIEDGEYDQATKMLLLGVTPAVVFEDGKTLMDIARENGEDQFAEVLQQKAQAGALELATEAAAMGTAERFKTIHKKFDIDLDHILEHDVTLEHIAANNLNVPVLKYLAEQGVPMDRHMEQYLTVADYARRWENKIAQGEEVTDDQLVAYNDLKSFIMEHDIPASTDLLCRAVKAGDMALVAAMLAKSVSPLEIYVDDQTLPEIAAEAGNEEMTALVNQAVTSVIPGHLATAVDRGDLERLRELNEHFKPNLDIELQDEHRSRLVHIAAKHANVRILGYLADQGADLVILDGHARTIGDYVDGLAQMANQDGVNMSAEVLANIEALESFADEKGVLSATMQARAFVEAKDYENAEKLFKAEVPAATEYPDGKTLKQVAQKTGDEKLIKLVQDHIAMDLYVVLMTQPSSPEDEQQKMAKIQDLVTRHDLDPKTGFQDGTNFAFAAVNGGNLGVVGHLLQQYGLPVNNRNGDGKTILDLFDDRVTALQAHKSQMPPPAFAQQMAVMGFMVKSHEILGLRRAAEIDAGGDAPETVRPLAETMPELQSLMQEFVREHPRGIGLVNSAALSLGLTAQVSDEGELTLEEIGDEDTKLQSFKAARPDGPS